MFLVKVRTVFSAAHRLCRTDFTDEQNFALYGKCSSPNGHGHNYELEVAIAGEIDPETGMVANFYDINRLIDELVYDKVDHRNLNSDVEFMRGIIPTAENMAKVFWEILEPHIEGGTLFSITIGERGNNVVIYYGPHVTLKDLRRMPDGAHTAVRSLD